MKGRTPVVNAIQSLLCPLLLVLLAGVSRVRSLPSDVAAQVARDVFLHKRLRYVVTCSCSEEEGLAWGRAFVGNGTEGPAVPMPMPVSVSMSTPGSLLSTLRAAQDNAGVLFRLGCLEAWDALQESSDARLLNGSFHWILVGNETTNRAELVRVAESLRLAVDSELTLAVRAPGPRSPSNPSGTVHLVDAYKVDFSQPLIAQLAGTWSQLAGLHHFLTGLTPARRRNLQGIQLKAGVLVNNLRRDGQLSKALSKPKDNNPTVSPVAAFSHVLTRHLQDLLNITLRLQNGSPDVHLRRMTGNDLHLITTATKMKAKLWNYIDYAVVPLWTERIIVVMKTPPALWTFDAYLRPLHWSVWLLVGLVTLTTAVGLRAVGHWEVKYEANHQGEEDSWNSAIMTSMGILCSQGFTNTSNWVSGRTLLLNFELFSLFMNVFYSSGIVSFLLTFPAPFARSVREIIDSPFAVGVDGNEFSVSSVSESGDALTRELYEKKVFAAADGGGFMDLEKASVAARHSHFAFIGAPFSTYDLLALTWSQSDICRMQEIQLRPPDLFSFVLSKGSPFREIINQGILLLVERGLYARERIRWSVFRPKCALSDVTEVDSVSIRPVGPVLGILTIGVMLSAVFLGLEILAYKKFHKRGSLASLASLDLLEDLRYDLYPAYSEKKAA